MNVAELIEKLKQMPQDALVVAEGYEDGFDTIKKVSLMAVEENPQPAWYLEKYIEFVKTDSQQVVFLKAESKSDKK